MITDKKTARNVGALLIILLSCLNCIQNHDGLNIKFPIVSEPMAITSGPEEHLFASYYGINSWSADQRYVTVLETPIKYRLPTENDPATLGLVDLETNEFIPLAETRAWNFQQGCMAHWLGTFPNSRIIYNDMVDGKYVSIILDVHTKQKIKTIPYPICAVSPNASTAKRWTWQRMSASSPARAWRCPVYCTTSLGSAPRCRSRPLAFGTSRRVGQLFWWLGRWCGESLSSWNWREAARRRSSTGCW